MSEEIEFDEKFQQMLKENIKNGIKKIPPCPKCDGEMEYWDCWLVTGNSCKKKDCGWTMSEGSGCLV